MQTDKVLVHNIPESTLVEKKKVWTIEMAIPRDNRIEVKELEKIRRYQDLNIEVERLWHKPALIVQVQ